MAIAMELAAEEAATMRAAGRARYGSPEAMELMDVERPTLTDDGVLVRIRAAALNRLDWYLLTGMPLIARTGAGFFRPKSPLLGLDFAGTVEAVGPDAEGFKPGDEVFGERKGALAEYLCASAAIALKPANISFEQAAATPLGGLTALQGLRDKGNVQPGQQVLIQGASGGVGTFAVQIAKSLGAEVTGVCSTRNLELVRSLGADHVIDYTKEDFAKTDQRYDVILDNVPNHSLSECRRILNPNGIYVMIGGGGPNDNRWVGPFGRVIHALLTKPFIEQKMGMMMAETNQKDLNFLADLMQSGKVKPVIDRTYKLNQIPEAIRYLEEGHARGKVVIAVD